MKKKSPLYSNNFPSRTWLQNSNALQQGRPIVAGEFGVIVTEVINMLHLKLARRIYDHES